MRCDNVGVLRPRPAVLDRALERTECLRPLAVFASVPKEERAARHAGDRHRAAPGFADALTERLAVLEIQVGIVASRT